MKPSSSHGGFSCGEALNASQFLSSEATYLSDHWGKPQHMTNAFHSAVRKLGYKRQAMSSEDD